MQFINDITTLISCKTRKIVLAGATVPTNKDIYFKAKQREILAQYQAARIFLSETETTDWAHWFSTSSDERNNLAFKKLYESYFYESALMYYNIIVDLSWTLCYISAEFAISNDGERIEFENCKPIEEAYQLLRNAENVVVSPTSESNPFAYLKKVCPDYSRAIKIIIDFWNIFNSSHIRKIYNYCKHKGKPAYEEIEKLRGEKLFNLSIRFEESEEPVEIASDVRDVQLVESLVESIAELKEFDDKQLFPYLKALFEELEAVINPSPFVL